MFVRMAYFPLVLDFVSVKAKTEILAYIYLTFKQS